MPMSASPPGEWRQRAYQWTAVLVSRISAVWRC